jgi:hypothetical protein
MIKQSLKPSKIQDTVNAVLAARSRNDILLFLIFFLTLLSITPFLTLWGVKDGMSVVLGTLVALILAAALVRWPVVGLYLVAACAFMVEQETLVGTPIVTDSLYVFYWPPQLEGFFERPIGLLFLISLFIWIFYRLVQRRPLLQGGALFGPFLLYMLCVFGAVVYGLGTGGNLKIIMVQFRPFWYMFLSYILAYNFVTRKSHVRGFFWLVIVSAGVKGLQGLYIYLILFHGDMTGHDTIMSHEESFFFAILLLLIVIFSLYYRYRPQLIAALCVAPAVLISMVANNRRTDYTALLLGIGVSWLLVFLIKPRAWRALVVGMIICVTLGAAYVGVFSHSGGSFAAPARALVATFNPSTDDVRNSTSNLYRTFENDDLKYTTKQYPLGLGFGKPFLQPNPLESIYPDIIRFDPYYNYVPHNTIYWIWVDLGPIGYFALWFLFGSVIIRGSVIARQLKDPYLQVVAIYIVAVTVMEIVVAYADYQLFFYRNVITLGLLCGLLVKLPLLDKEQKEVQKNESIDGFPTSSLSLVGSQHP